MYNSTELLHHIRLNQSSSWETESKLCNVILKIEKSFRVRSEERTQRRQKFSIQTNQTHKASHPLRVFWAS